MTRKQFRQATVRARLQLIHGSGSDADTLTALEQVAAEALRKTWQQVDLLACRLSGFTPDARSRIALYPL